MDPRRAVDHVLTVEDVIIHKLIAWRLRDRDDIRSILEAAVSLEVAYLDHWIAQWNSPNDGPNSPIPESKGFGMAW